MFTGIIEAVGEVLSLKKAKGGAILTVSTPWSSPKIGDSIAINGCCLTVISKKKKQLSFDLSDETLRKAALGSLFKGSPVNLERALKVSGRFDGHFVLGHVDGVGSISQMKRSPSSLTIEIKAPKSVSEYLIEKGSVTVEGVSLTASKVSSKNFNVTIIPHTEKMTNLGSKKVGDKVNLEADVLGKYINKLLKR